MAQLTFATDSFVVGFSDTFFAAGEQKDFHLQGLDWDDPVPSVGSLRLQWRFSSVGDALADYRMVADACMWPMADRDEAVRGWSDAPTGYLWRAHEGLSLHVFFPPSSGLIETMTAAAAGRRRVSFFSNDLHWGAEGAPDLAFPSIDGFLDRHEPSFIGKVPIVRIEHS